MSIAVKMKVLLLCSRVAVDHGGLTAVRFQCHQLTLHKYIVRQERETHKQQWKLCQAVYQQPRCKTVWQFCNCTPIFAGNVLQQPCILLIRIVYLKGTLNLSHSVRVA